MALSMCMQLENRRARERDNSIQQSDADDIPEPKAVVAYTPVPTPTTTFLLQQRMEARRLLNGWGIPRMASFEREPFVARVSRPIVRQLSFLEERVLEHGTQTTLPWQRSAEPSLSRSTSGDQIVRRQSIFRNSIALSAISNRVSIFSGLSSRFSRELESNDSLVVGAHRDGYSDTKCRHVLITKCAAITRQYNYSEGLKQIYLILREYVGDENLDLVSGVLYEMIEIPVDFQWEEGGIFQRWKYEHRRRDDLVHISTPALGNVIVGTKIPTDSLRLHRQHQSNPTTPSTPMSSNQSPTCTQITPCSQTSFPEDTQRVPSNSLRSQKEWQIDYSCFVSSAALGTQIHIKPPTPADLHLMIWDASFGRGGRFVQHREIHIPEDAVVRGTIEGPIVLTRRQSFSRRIKEILDRAYETATEFTLECSVTILNSAGVEVKPRKKKFNQRALYKRKKCPCDKKGHRSVCTQIYEKRGAVRNLPEPDSPEGRDFYANITTHPLPDGFVPPTEGFVRKHELVPRDSALSPATLVTAQLPLVEDLALRRYQQAVVHAAALRCHVDVNGPFTNDLFKDGGMDFLWDVPKTEMAGKSSDAKTVRWEVPVAAATDSDSGDNVEHGRPIDRPRTPLDFARLNNSTYNGEEGDKIEDSPDSLSESVNLSRFSASQSVPPHWSRRPSDILESALLGERSNRSVSEPELTPDTTILYPTVYKPQLRGGAGYSDWEVDDAHFDNKYVDDAYVKDEHIDGDQLEDGLIDEEGLDDEYVDEGQIDEEEAIRNTDEKSDTHIEDQDIYFSKKQHNTLIVPEHFPEYNESYGNCVGLSESSNSCISRLVPVYGYTRNTENGILVRQTSLRRRLSHEWPLSRNTALLGLSISNAVQSTTLAKLIRKPNGRHIQINCPNNNTERPFSIGQETQELENPHKRKYSGGSSSPRNTNFPTKTSITLEDPFILNSDPPSWLISQYRRGLPSRYTLASTKRAARKLAAHKAECNCSTCQLDEAQRVLLGFAPSVAQSDPFRVTSHPILPSDSDIVKANKLEFNRLVQSMSRKMPRKLFKCDRLNTSNLDTGPMNPYDSDAEERYPELYREWKRAQELEAENDDNSARLEGYSSLNDDDVGPSSAPVHSRSMSTTHRVSSLQTHTQRTTPSIGNAFGAVPGRRRALSDPSDNREPSLDGEESSFEGAVSQTSTAEHSDVASTLPRYPPRTSSIGAIDGARAMPGNTSRESSPFHSIFEGETLNTFDDSIQATTGPLPRRANTVGDPRRTEEVLILQPPEHSHLQNRTQRYSHENERRINHPSIYHGVTRSNLVTIPLESPLIEDTGEILLPLTYVPPPAEFRIKTHAVSSEQQTGLPNGPINHSTQPSRNLAYVSNREDARTRATRLPSSNGNFHRSRQGQSVAQYSQTTSTIHSTRYRLLSPRFGRSEAVQPSLIQSGSVEPQQISPTSVYSDTQDQLVVPTQNTYYDTQHLASSESSVASIKNLYKKVSKKTKGFFRINASSTENDVIPAPGHSFVPDPLFPPTMDRQTQYDLLKFLEHSIRNASGIFLSLEFLNRRISIDTLAPIEKEWKKNHAEVPNHFYYDVEHQHRILRTHINALNFKGGYSHRSVDSIVTELGQLAALFKDEWFEHIGDDDTIREVIRMAANILYILGAPPEVMSRVSILKNDHEANAAAAVARRGLSSSMTPGVDGSFGLTPALQPYPISRIAAPRRDQVLEIGENQDHGVNMLLVNPTMAISSTPSVYSTALFNSDPQPRSVTAGIFTEPASGHTSSFRGSIMRSLSRRGRRGS